jgi:N-acetylglucosamine kinase-like BadF-type ATPase
VVYLGIDGGGSKTAFVLENESGKILGRAETGPSNWLSAGKEVAERNIADGIRQLNFLPEIVGCGFAGAGRPEGIQFFKDTISALLPRAQVFVETDAFISYIGAIGLEPGVLLIAGTGSIAIGRRADGAMVRVGGWGPIFGDEGSGFWIGREVIQTALRAHDARVEPEFVSSVCETLQLKSITDVAASWKSGTLTVSSVASLASLIFHMYPAEDSSRILNAAAEHLWQLSKTAIGLVGIPSCRRSIVGSVGTQPLMKQLIREHGDTLDFNSPRHSPEHGAIVWARSQMVQNRGQ